MSKPTIALLGSGGAVGSALSGLLFSRLDTFRLRIISRRAPSPAIPSPDVEQVQLDFASTNESEWKDALRDVRVAIFGFSSQKGTLFDVSKRAMDACAADGVRLVILSEFTGSLDGEHVDELLVWNDKIRVRKYAIALQQANFFAWSSVNNVSFLEWGLRHSFSGFDPSSSVARLKDGGTHPFAVSSIATVSEAVLAIIDGFFRGVAVNRPFFVADQFVTQTLLLDIFRRHSKADWTIEHVSSDASLLEGFSLFRSGQTGIGYAKIITSVIVGDQARYREAGSFEKEAERDMKELGIEAKGVKAIEKAIQQLLQEQQK